VPVSGWVVAHIPVAVSDLYPIAVRNKAHIESNCRHATSVHVAELSQRARCEHCTAGHTATLVHHTVRAVTIARESAGRESGKQSPPAAVSTAASRRSRLAGTASRSSAAAGVSCASGTRCACQALRRPKRQTIGASEPAVAHTRSVSRVAHSFEPRTIADPERRALLPLVRRNFIAS
jgi:hypothetical protein